MSGARRELSWLEEQRLIWVAQHPRDDRERDAAVARLMADNDSFVVAWAAKVASFTGARKVEADLAQEGRIVLYERIFGYEFGRSPSWAVWGRYLAYAVEIARVGEIEVLHRAGKKIPRGWLGWAEVRSKDGTTERVRETPENVRKLRADRLQPARLFSYAFRKLVSTMKSHACDALEIVRLPRSSKVHAAHRLVDAGHSSAVVAAELGLDPEVAASLVRVTMPEQEEDPSEREAPGDRMEGRQHAGRVLERLPPDVRTVLVLLIAIPDSALRAEILEVDAYSLWLIERDATARFEELAATG